LQLSIIENHNLKKEVAMLKRVFLIVVVTILASQCLNAGDIAQAKLKDKKTALNYSLIGTTAPIVAGAIIFFGFSDKFDNYDDAESIVAASVAGCGLIFGPAIGHCYAGQYLYLLKGFLLRGLPIGLAISLAALANGMRTGLGRGRSSSSGFESQQLILPGLLITSAVYDICTVKKSVEKYNNKVKSSGLSLAPHYFPEKSAPGIMLSYTF
jgi:hypothetical protein